MISNGLPNAFCIPTESKRRWTICLSCLLRRCWATWASRIASSWAPSQEAATKRSTTAEWEVSAPGVRAASSGESTDWSAVNHSEFHQLHPIRRREIRGFESTDCSTWSSWMLCSCEIGISQFYRTFLRTILSSISSNKNSDTAVMIWKPISLASEWPKWSGSQSPLLWNLR